MAYESKSFKEHHLTRLPVLEKLIALGWERDQIICPSPDSDDTEWHVPKTPSEATNREDLGDRYRLIEIPYTDDKSAAEKVSQCYRDYFIGLDELQKKFDQMDNDL